MNMVVILAQVLTFLFLLYAYLVVSDEKSAKHKFLNGIKSVMIMISAAAVLRFGRNIYVISIVIIIGIAALVKRDKKNKHASLDT
jgi:chromate transport protein ChrA